MGVKVKLYIEDDSKDCGYREALAEKSQVDMMKAAGWQEAPSAEAVAEFEKAQKIADEEKKEAEEAQKIADEEKAEAKKAQESADAKKKKIAAEKK